MGIPVARRAGVRSDGSVRASTRERARRQSSDAATLEVTLIGPELEFDDDRARCCDRRGVRAHAYDGRAMTHRDGVCSCRAGARASVRRARTRGARAYLAVSGGIDVPMVLGSRATHVWPDGRASTAARWRRDDRLPLGVPVGDWSAPPRVGARPTRTPRPGGQRVCSRACSVRRTRPVLPPARSTSCSRRLSTVSTQTRIAWAIAWTVRRCDIARCRHHLGRDAARHHAGARAPGSRSC